MSDSEVLLEFISVTGCFVKYYDKKCSFMQGFADTVYIYLSVGNLAKISSISFVGIVTIYSLLIVLVNFVGIFCLSLH